MGICQPDRFISIGCPGINHPFLHYYRKSFQPNLYPTKFLSSISFLYAINTTPCPLFPQFSPVLQCIYRYYNHLSFFIPFTRYSLPGMVQNICLYLYHTFCPTPDFTYQCFLFSYDQSYWLSGQLNCRSPGYPVFIQLGNLSLFTCHDRTICHSGL